MDDKRVFSSDLHRRFTDVVSSAYTGFSTAGKYSNIIEYEVMDGLYVGIDPEGGTDKSVSFTVYIYAADIQEMYKDEVALVGGDTDANSLTKLQSEIMRSLNAALSDESIDWREVMKSKRIVDFDGKAGRYYIFEVPKSSVGTKEEA